MTLNIFKFLIYFLLIKVRKYRYNGMVDTLMVK